MTDDVLGALRDRLAGVHMEQPLDMIERRARRYRRTRRFAGLAGLTGFVAAAGLALALAQPSAGDRLAVSSSSGRPKAGTAASGGSSVLRIQLAAFTLIRTGDGTVTVTFTEVAADPKGLETALSQAGVTAIVRLNEACEPASPSSDVPNVYQYIDFQVDKGSAPSAAPPVARPATGFSIHTAALPKSMTLSVGLAVNRQQAVDGLAFGLFPTGDPTRCVHFG